MEPEYEIYVLILKAILFICNKLSLQIAIVLRDYESHLCQCASLLVSIFM